MADPTMVMFAVFFAASLPFVISILVALKPSLRYQTAVGYFLSRQQLSPSDFIATTIGYSLQVSSIFLFFYWGIKYGLWPLIMCVTWFGGYYLMSELVRSGKLDDFLGLAKENEPMSVGEIPSGVQTIHGYIGQRIFQPTEPGRRIPQRFAVIMLSLASLIGIAGTMMTEIDYSTSFFLQGVGMELSNVVQYSTQISMLLFTTFYVLWGGFRATVLTDRFQVPAAYVGLGIFTVGLSFYAQQLTNGKPFQNGAAVVWLLLVLVVLYGTLFWFRFSAVKERGDPWSRTIAYLTFGSLLFITLTAIGFTPQWSWEKGLEALVRLLFPDCPLQFIFLGGTSLLVTNLLWQMIDISSLQRLQALNRKDIKDHRFEIAGVIRNTGAEAGLGWTLIIVCALFLKIVGIEDSNQVIQKLLGANLYFSFLVPIFMFTVVVFMLSTISGFISAVAYIAHFDVAPALGIYQPNVGRPDAAELQITRLVTLVCVILIYLGYTVLRLKQNVFSTEIATILYAIWSFQLAIAPSVWKALLTKEVLFPSAIIVSVTSGMVVGWLVATNMPWFGLPIKQEIWGMLAPVAVVIASLTTLIFVNFVIRRRKSV